MDNIIEKSQFWKEEHEKFKSYISYIPNNGIYTEIGTADGLSAKSMFDYCKSKNVKIYTIDIFSSEYAKDILAETDVVFIQGDSVYVAENWNSFGSKNKIDFLFIDGDHSFNGVYRDFYNWGPHLSRDGVILFHDLDPIERGGIAHLGVEIFIRTLIQEKVIDVISHEYRFLLCRLSNNRQIDIECFINYFINIKKEIIGQYGHRNLVDLMKVFKSPDSPLSSLQKGFLFEYLYLNRFQDLKNHTEIPSVLNSYFETLSMLNTFDDFFILNKLETNNLIFFNKVISYEQTKLFFYKEIINKTFKIGL
jgi:hypothetical protein